MINEHGYESGAHSDQRLDPPATEDALLQAAKRGERAAFTALTEQNLAKLHRFVAREIRYMRLRDRWNAARVRRTRS